MADVRTMKLNLLADIADFSRGMAKAETDTKGLSGKVNKYSKLMAASFAAAGAAAGAMAVKFGVDAVKAAAADEQSQLQLAKTMQNVIGATDEAIAANEKWITSTQYRTGVSDTKLRIGMQRLVRSTKDVQEAQVLSNLATDIAASTGKDYETVVMALAKANDGQFTALKKLGITMGDNTENAKELVKENTKLSKLQQDMNNNLEAFGPSSDEYLKSQEKVADQQAIVNELQAAGVDWVGELSKEFGGSAATAAKTYAGQMQILQERFGEFQEGIGTKILPILGRLLTTVNDVAKGFGGEQKDSLSNRAQELSGNLSGNGAYSLGESLRKVADAFSKLFTVLVSGDAEAGENNLTNLAKAMENVANGINSVANAFAKGKAFFTWWAKQETALQDFLGVPDSARGIATKGGAAGGMVRAGQAITVGEYGKETFIPTSGGQIVPKGQLGGGGNTFILNGIVDAESARRSIEKLMQDSSRRTGAVNFVGATL